MFRRTMLLIWVYFLLLLLTDLVGLALTLFTLPGLWLMLAAAAVYAWLTRAHYVGKWSLIILFVLALGAEIAEFSLGGVEAKKQGASRWGIIGGFVGAILGGLFLTALISILPAVNTIIGICLGSFIGAFVMELLMGTPIDQSFRIGVGSAKGRLTGIAGKAMVAVAMLLITFIMGIPLHRH